MKRNKIYGLMMRPSLESSEDNERVMHSSDLSVKSKFYEAYSNHIAGMQIVAECAKVYILNNWDKVKDWSDLNVVMEDNNSHKKDTDYVEYFNYKEKKRSDKHRSGKSIVNKMFDDMDKRDKLKHNPVTEIKDVVLDPSDGDMSLTVNGRMHMWISDSTVIIIANYIEEQLR